MRNDLSALRCKRILNNIVNPEKLIDLYSYKSGISKSYLSPIDAVRGLLLKGYKPEAILQFAQ